MNVARTHIIVAMVLGLSSLVITSHARSSLPLELSEDSFPPLGAPVRPVDVEALAHLPVHPWLPGHRGVDLTSSPGAAVYSPGPGTVTFSGVVVDRPVLTVTLDNGMRSSVEPVVGVLEVGARVAGGTVVGKVAEGPSHCSPATCVHWGLRDESHYVDPLDYLAGYGPVRLLAGPRDTAVPLMPGLERPSLQQ